MQPFKSGQESSLQTGEMSGQTDSEFRNVTTTDTSRNLQYNFLTSPVPFECPETILSLSSPSSASQTVGLDPDSRVFTPIPYPPRVSTPYPVIDSASCGKDWPGLSPENKLFPSPWGFEPTLHIGQQFQGGVLPVVTGNSHTVHPCAFPQNWHQAVTSPQNFSFHSNDFWFPGDSTLAEGFGSVGEGSDIIEQDSKVTSSTELESSWKQELVLPPVAELLNLSNGSIKCERVSPVEIKVADKKQQNIHARAVGIKPKGAISCASLTSKEARTQTPWNLKNPKSTPVAPSLIKRKEKPRKTVNPHVYSHQKTVQRERERAIRDKIQNLSTILPQTDLRKNRPSRKEILESAISHIMQLQEDIREAYLQEGLKTEDLKAALQGNMVPNLSTQSCVAETEQQHDAPLISDECSSLPSTPDGTVDGDLPITSASSISELSSQGSEESETTSHSSKHVKRPMNAFILFSKNHRTLFKQLYPGRDNRKISTLLAEKWRSMKPEEKEPYRSEAKELMRQTKASHPDFKYCDGIKKTGLMTANGESSKHAGLDEGYRIGTHNLRQRVALYTSKRDLKPTPKSSKSQQDKKPNIQTNSLPRKLYEILPATTFETKSVQKVATANDPPYQYNNQSLVRQILQSCDSHNSGPSFEASMEWHHNSCDDWVQCEHCKQWYMLPDEMDPASLPDKWYCCKC